VFGVAEVRFDHVTKIPRLRRISPAPILIGIILSLVGLAIKLMYCIRCGMAARLPVSTGDGVPQRVAGIRQWFPLFLFGLALIPRLAALERYITPDELIWVFRSVLFREALLAGRWAETLVAGHPGVITSWVGALGITFQLWLFPAHHDTYLWLTRLPFLMPDNVEAYIRLAEFLSAARLLVAIVNSLGIVAVYFLLRRLWGSTAAVLGSLFLALDPFLSGLSGLLHVDGLSTTFATLSLLLLLVGRDRQTARRFLWLAFAGVAAGFAVLTKTPTLLLLPVMVFVLLVYQFLDRDQAWPVRISGVILNILVMGSSLVLTVFILFPAMWVSPAEVLATVTGSANRHIDEALRESFFLGRIAYDHGPLFYPVVLLWRLSPVIWLALIPLIFLFGSLRGGQVDIRNKGLWAALILLFWSAMFLIAITPAAKKFDRYILPVVPAFLLLAAYIWTRWGARYSQLARWVLPGVILIQFLFWLAHAAYPLAAYNPLVGGGRTAVRVLPAGWGEGISASGRWLAGSQPAVADERAIAGVAASLAPFFSGRTQIEGLDDPATADYVIVTAGDRQLNPAAGEEQTEELDLLNIIRFGGLDQAWVYRREIPQPAIGPDDLPAPVIFGNRLALTAIAHTLENDAVRLLVRWQRLARLGPDERFVVRLAVVDEAGNVWAASEYDLLNENYHFPADWDEDLTGPVRTLMELPPAIPPGRYQLRLSLIDARSGGQLPIQTAGNGFQGVVFDAGQIDITLPDAVVSASRVQIPQSNGTRWLDESLWLLGHGRLPEAVLAGSDLPVEMFWHAPVGNLPAGMQIVWSLNPVGGSTNKTLVSRSLSRFDSADWRAGETIHERYRLPIPPSMQPGEYTLVAQPALEDGSLITPPATLGQVTVDNIDRQYSLPDDTGISLNTCFGEIICLVGINLETETADPGESVGLTLYWQALSEPDGVYTSFLHLLDETGSIVLASDHWPGGLPSDIWDTGQVITDRVSLALPGNLQLGTYSLRVGLYSAEDGRRLPVTSVVEEPDHLILPLTLEISGP
jgi:hypothetical protein